MVQVTRRERESTGALIRRFTRRVQRAGVLLQARKIRFLKPKANRGERRRAAHRRAALTQEYEMLYKMGKLDEGRRSS
ncbi:MAG: hypothetical protein A2991_01545 [Candidatus Terrybacteria bacterium RIFCSPLOWO2_01_FULL_58_14]|uniref:30S ribosomal protein S21 n=2 Tax=Candidatus Terryibacteriota TaxID=1817920 RepID=A0A1G2Q0F2_9BACT|nr:MAG: hypothetical protein A2682_03130 [Candidatus Terrybacteria bacterium RIFCSPHIGHO2_01_FULL_58_15]OHA53321.1 MAG: hypothetical protein A2991_01545 [Candidatus Terrybacteria bacterium RIFCSPLOWO2_01_FULL_58_14]